ncbi:hypothetical protein Tco_0452350 [Tanacetum coccineum]
MDLCWSIRISVDQERVDFFREAGNHFPNGVRRLNASSPRWLNPKIHSRSLENRFTQGIAGYLPGSVQVVLGILVQDDRPQVRGEILAFKQEHPLKLISKLIYLRFHRFVDLFISLIYALFIIKPRRIWTYGGWTGALLSSSGSDTLSILYGLVIVLTGSVFPDPEVEAERALDSRTALTGVYEVVSD